MTPDPKPETMRLTVLVHGDALAALDEANRPLRCDVRDVLKTAKGGVINLPRAWMGARVVVVELPEAARKAIR